VGSFAVGLIVLAYFVARRVGGRAGLVTAIAVSITLFVVAISWAGMGATVSRFTLVSADVPGRWVAWRDTVRIIQDFPLFGVGLGNYGLAMFVYQTAARDALNGMFMQAHNDYLQVAAEGGLLVVIPAILAVAFLLRTVRQRVLAGDDDPLTYWARAGAIAGLASMAAQSVLEFSLQMPGVTVLFTVLLAIAVHRAPTMRSSPERPVRPGLQDAHRV
jgi:O-antigen ligase